MGTAIHRGTSSSDNLGAKAAAYGMRYAECNGMDVIDTWQCFTREAEKTRGSTSEALGLDDAGEGPCFVNVKTDRYQGHSMSDPQKYRDKSQYDAMKKDETLDPILRMRVHLMHHGLATEEELDEMDKKAKVIAKESVKFAEQSDDTPYDELYTDVYSEPFEPPFVKGEPHPDFK